MLTWSVHGLSLWQRLASFVALLALWHIASLLIGARLLPPPATVAAVLAADIADGTLPYHIGITLARVAVSFVLAMLIGAAIGLAMGRLPKLDRFFDGWLVLFLNVPALVTIVLCYVWFGLVEAAAITAVAVNKIPTVVVTVREGARALSPDYLEMARVFRFGRMKTLRHVMLPELAPFLLAAARSGLALIWKIVLVVELLGRSNGVGFQISVFFQFFDVASILAYTIAFVIVIQMIEWLVLRPIEQRTSRWRR
ncbi:MAG TPA: ABC transporter permease [Dongiaceae bacterium]|jgi:NitT/TauT family transport system permease protein|nr:ABC transporter permease [Dongiaceae bacterium]